MRARKRTPGSTWVATKYVARKGLGPRWVCAQHGLEPMDSSLCVEEISQQERRWVLRVRSLKLGTMKSSGVLRQGDKIIATGVSPGGAALALQKGSHRSRSKADWAAWAQETSYRSKMMALGDRCRGLAWGELPLAAALLVATLIGTLRA